MEADQKLSLLKRLLDQESGRTLIFVRTKRATERLGQKLAKAGMSVAVIHGDRSQSITATLIPALASFCPSRSVARLDRKSTRLNSSHLGISYAVLRLKKKSLHRGPGLRRPSPLAARAGGRRGPLDIVEIANGISAAYQAVPDIYRAIPPQGDAFRTRI